MQMQNPGIKETPELMELLKKLKDQSFPPDVEKVIFIYSGILDDNKCYIFPGYKKSYTKSNAHSILQSRIRKYLYLLDIDS